MNEISILLKRLMHLLIIFLYYLRAASLSEFSTYHFSPRKFCTPFLSLPCVLHALYMSSIWLSFLNKFGKKVEMLNIFITVLFQSHFNSEFLILNILFNVLCSDILSISLHIHCSQSTSGQRSQSSFNNYAVPSVCTETSSNKQKLPWHIYVV